MWRRRRGVSGAAGTVGGRRGPGVEPDQPAMSAVDRAGALVVAAVIPSAIPLFGGGGAGWLAAAVAAPVLAGLAVEWAPTRFTRFAVLDGFAGRVSAAAAGVLVILAFLPAGPGGRPALGSLGNGGAEVVTGALPLVAGGHALGMAVVAFSAATFASVEVARRGGLLLPLLPPLLLYGAVLLVTAGGVAEPRYGALLVAATSALTVLLRHHRAWWGAGSADPGPRVLGSGRGSGRAGRGPLWLGLLIAGGAGLVAWSGAGGAILPGATARQPYDLRAALRPPPVPLDRVSLLSRFASIHDGPIQPAFEATVEGAPPGQTYWRVASFDQFRGARGHRRRSTARPDGRYPLPRRGAPGRPVHRDGLGWPDRRAYLPVIGTPLSVSVEGLAVSAPDNLLVVPAGTPPPSSYSVRSVLAAPNEAQLLSARIPGAPFDPGRAPQSPTVTTTGRPSGRPGPTGCVLPPGGHRRLPARTAVRAAAARPFADRQRYLSGGPAAVGQPFRQRRTVCCRLRPPGPGHGDPPPVWSSATPGALAPGAPSSPLRVAI